MKLRVPRYVAFPGPSYFEDTDGSYRGVPLVMEYMYDHYQSVPTFFVDTRGRQFNDVAHVKPCEVSGDDLIIPRGVATLSKKNIICHSALVYEDYLPRTRADWNMRAYSLDNGRAVVRMMVSSAGRSSTLNIGYTYVNHYWLYYYITPYVIGRMSISCQLDHNNLVHASVYWPDHATPSWLDADVYFSRGLTATKGPYKIQDESRSVMDAKAAQVVDLCEKLLEELTYKPEIGSMWDHANPPRAVFYPEYKDFPTLDRSCFLFSEADTIMGVPGLAMGKSSNYYWMHWLDQHAFVDACDSFPRMNDNNISNIIEICSFIYNAVILHRIALPKRLSEAWLQYRYQYNTTKSVVKEAARFLKRNLPPMMFGQGATSHGVASHDVDGIDVTCRCTIGLVPQELGYLDKLWHGLYTYGLQPNFYVIWDMVPYSFIVDWLIPVGSIAHVADVRANFSEGTYKLSKCIFSYTYVREVDKNFSMHCYSRLVKSPPDLQGLYWFDAESNTSSKVILFRFLDVASLLLGRS